MYHDRTAWRCAFFVGKKYGSKGYPHTGNATHMDHESIFGSENTPQHIFKVGSSLMRVINSMLWPLYIRGNDSQCELNRGVRLLWRRGKYSDDRVFLGYGSAKT
jgi:hypothetical protein